MNFHKLFALVSLLVIAATLLSACAPAATPAPAPTQAPAKPAEPTLSSVLAGGQRVAILDGRVSLILPPGFQALTKEEIERKFPQASPPQHVFANDTQSVSIAITLSSSALTQEQLPEFKASMEKTLERNVAGLKWIKRDYETISGQRWIYFELTSQAIDTDIHNLMYFTTLGGKVLMFNFNSTESRYPAMRELLEASKNSIELKK
jgi:hypothetical protein